MNKELIKKYKKEFDWWLDGGGVLIRFYNKESWCSINDYEEGEDHFWSNGLGYFREFRIIIDDKYVELRKALVDDKTIQYKAYNMANEYKWSDWEDGDLFEDNYEYRVKPDERKFKVGDWLRDTKSNEIFMLSSINEDVDIDCLMQVYEEDTLELWQPKKGEWCWFWEFEEIPRLDRFKEMLHDRYITENKYNYRHCEPFINQLPTNIKDKQ